VTKTGPAGPVQTGQFVVYTITTTNPAGAAGCANIAQEVRLSDTLDPNLGFVSLTVDDGFAGNNTACFSLPSQGLADAPIDCINTSMAPGTTTTYTLTVQVNNCIGAGVDIANTALITTVSTDPDPSNNEATTSFTTSEDGTCTDIVCDGVTCFADLCTNNDHCEAGVCVTSAVTCNDNSFCTDDSCSSAVGCVYDSTNSGDLCDDFNTCTANTCDPLLFCQFPAEPATASCDDGLTCTGAGATDHCDGQGNCVGTSVCSDGNACTDDFADEANACACSYANGFPGTPCDDSNACTGNVTAGDSCDDAGVCVGGQAVVCVASDQCHDAGTCDTASGFCSDPAKPDGTTCDDGNAGTSGDDCQGGVCAGDPCTSTNSPKSKGWYKGLCQNAHSGDSLSDADAACVGELTQTFAGISTVSDLCAVLMPSQPNNDSCGRAEDQLMTLALNICKQRVCPSNAIDSAYGNNSSVAQSLAESDAIFADDGRTTATCNHAELLDREINNGHALELDTLLSVREGSNLRLNWTAPNVDDGVGHVDHYTIYRRAVGSKVPFVQIGTTTGLTFLDGNAGTGSWEYDLVPNY
jgi:uncharacterized repeat protein (TIGR01451 family)